MGEVGDRLEIGGLQEWVCGGLDNNAGDALALGREQLCDRVEIEDIWKMNVIFGGDGESFEPQLAIRRSAAVVSAKSGCRWRRISASGFPSKSVSGMAAGSSPSFTSWSSA